MPAATCSTIGASGSISSGSLDKIRYEFIINSGLIKRTLTRLIAPARSRFLAFDTTKNKLVNNAGMIGMSGTKAYVEVTSASGDISVVGQFGGGLNSAYLVSEYIRAKAKARATAKAKAKAMENLTMTKNATCAEKGVISQETVGHDKTMTRW